MTNHLLVKLIYVDWQSEKNKTKQLFHTQMTSDFKTVAEISHFPS